MTRLYVFDSLRDDVAFEVVFAEPPLALGEPYAMTVQNALVIPANERLEFLRWVVRTCPSLDCHPILGPDGAIASLYHDADYPLLLETAPRQWIRRFHIVFHVDGPVVDALDETPEEWLISAVLAMAEATWIKHGYKPGPSAGWLKIERGGDHGVN